MSEFVAFPTVAPRPLKDRVILVTGAHGGLGAEAAKACAQAGATVVLLGRKVPKLGRVYDAIKAIGPEPALYPMDLAGADPSDFETLADTIARELGRLDGVLHCAADFAGLTPLENTLPEQFARQMQVNLNARWFLTQACLPLLRKSADAAVVFVLDDPARVLRPYWGAYGLTQLAGEGLVRMLHAETDTTTVRVSGLRPGPMKTSLRSRAFVDEAMLRVPGPEAYAAACVMLLSAEGAAHRGSVHAPSAAETATA
ncbi:SDR family NAD(P)-dependent oxidoreductase [Silanimonas sp.]|jgi:NAD(P)-dependent dehydrogenase (short-subunit alcohol dehydrogenase family)|uniref:SDR family NAD(P)-dependent oxidoreductase n=1 Tax=Silanimonas sp. TaxID=1929290 RepID=UPI0037C83E4C